VRQQNSGAVEDFISPIPQFIWHVFCGPRCIYALIVK